MFFKNPNLFSGILGTLFLLTEQYNRPDGSAQPTLYEFIFSAMTDAHNHSADPLHAKKEAWSGRFSEPVAEFVLRYTQSVSFDKRMAAADIAGSLAHAQMLAACGVISPIAITIAGTLGADPRAFIMAIAIAAGFPTRSRRVSSSGSLNSKTFTSTSKRA